MSKRYAVSLFIFRRDLRLSDNTGLNQALIQSGKVLPCFIFDPRQIDSHPYQSKFGLQFMLESLADLQKQLKDQRGSLCLFRGNPVEIIACLQNPQAIEAVYVNRDYTPFSLQRDAEIHSYCQQNGLDFHVCADTLLHEPEEIIKEDGSAYQVFSAFYKRAKQQPINAPQALRTGRWQALESADTGMLPPDLASDRKATLAGGRSQAFKRLNQLKDCRSYERQRDFPALAATSNLSPYLKFGCCSVREAYYSVMAQLGVEHALLRQFYWRDFFTHIAFHSPHIFGQAFHKRFDAINWRNDSDEFAAWRDGRTGFPIVDAGMRQLKKTGGLHNRVRMVVASFLVKDLHISWRWGERYFAQQLLDYDPCVNNGNWQWAASTGCDAQPYFRIFNPWLQQKKFDADCSYIKAWIPELRQYPPAIIHNWHKNPLAGSYPVPIVDHALRSQQAKLMFGQVSG